MQSEWQHSKECMCPLQNIAMCDYQESASTRQTHRFTHAHGQTDTQQSDQATEIWISRWRLTLHSPLQSCLWWCGWRPYLTQSPTELFVMVWLAALPYTVPYRAVCDGVVGGLTLHSPLQSCLWWCGWWRLTLHSPLQSCLRLMAWLAACW